MNRIAKAFIAASCAVVTAFGFAACDFGINSPKSAYQVAVENGFTGTEQEWLNSLKGSNGSDGSDLDIEEVYNVAVSNGYGGTFLEFLKEYLSVNVSENNNTDTIAHNMMSVVSVCCGFTVTTTIGGGFFGSMIKHGRMEDAGAAMERAKDDLYRLQSELRDIEVPMDFQVDVGGFLSFADMFFDNIFVDWMVQSRINDARDQVVEATARVQTILADLQEWEWRLLKG